jgi:hypothetical protein
MKLSTWKIGLLAVSLFQLANPLVNKVDEADTPSERTIVLVAGETAKVDDMGHHDYLAGCKCLETLLRQTPGVNVIQVSEGWPADEQVLDKAHSVVFYTDGGGKQAFLTKPERVANLQKLADKGVGIVMIHQAVDFPETHVAEESDGLVAFIELAYQAAVIGIALMWIFPNTRLRMVLCRGRLTMDGSMGLSSSRTGRGSPRWYGQGKNTREVAQAWTTISSHGLTSDLMVVNHFPSPVWMRTPRGRYPACVASC